MSIYKYKNQCFFGNFTNLSVSLKLVMPNQKLSYGNFQIEL